MIIPLPDHIATEKLAGLIAPHLASGDVLALYGELGAGKTTFVREILRELGINSEVPSPTFTLLQTYDAHQFRISHFDFYRLKDAADLEELGWDDALTEGVTIVEWPDRAEVHLPQDYLALKFIHDKKSRYVEITPHGNWEKRLKGALK